MKPEGEEIISSVFSLTELLVNELQFVGQEFKTLFWCKQYYCLTFLDCSIIVNDIVIVGGDNVRKYWPHYFAGAQGIVRNTLFMYLCFVKIHNEFHW